jgi:hypothetical protein
MRWNRTLLVLVLLAVLPLSARAGLLFGKKAKSDPAVHVPELIATVRADGDESKRAAAAEELHEYDPAAYPDIIPVLVDALLHDPKPAVRAQAAESLGKLRGIHQEVGWALEQAVSKDASMRVRLQARSALLMYHMSGYHGGKHEEAPTVQTKEPPLADPGPATLKPAPAIKGAPVRTETAPPPLADPAPAVQPAGAPRPLPAGPPPSPLVPTAPPTLQPAPASSGGDQGPELTPPTSR